jgi:uncharacterized protein YuzE
MPKMPKRMIPLFLVIVEGPIFVGDGFITYEILFNKAFERAYIEAIALGVVGAIMFAIAPLGGAHQRPLVIASFIGGLFAVLESAVFLFTFGQPGLRFGIGSPWMALIPFSLALAGGAVFNIRYRHMIGLRQANAVDIDISPYLALVPALKGTPQHTLWSHYDPVADTLAIHFTEPDTPNVASDSDMTDDDIIVRYNDAGEVIGLTILHASSRK